MIGIVIVAHGGLAREYLAALEHVVGHQDAILAISIAPEHDRALKEAEICAAVDAVDEGYGVVVVTDMFGGSPSNLSLRACAPADRVILYGANLPMLIKLAKSRGEPLRDAVDHARAAGRKYIDAFEAQERGGTPSGSGGPAPRSGPGGGRARRAASVGSAPSGSASGGSAPSGPTSTGPASPGPTSTGLTSPDPTSPGPTSTGRTSDGSSPSDAVSTGSASAGSVPTVSARNGSASAGSASTGSAAAFPGADPAWAAPSAGGPPNVAVPSDADGTGSAHSAAPACAPPHASKTGAGADAATSASRGIVGPQADRRTRERDDADSGAPGGGGALGADAEKSPDGSAVPGNDTPAARSSRRPSRTTSASRAGRGRRAG